MSSYLVVLVVLSTNNRPFSVVLGWQTDQFVYTVVVMSSDLLSTNEAAELLSVGASTVKRWADEGRLQCVKTAGGHRRFPRAAVVAMLSDATAGEAEISAGKIINDQDGHYTLSLMYQLRSRYGAWWVVAEQLATFLHKVGTDWEAGDMSIVQEHTISERLLRAIAAVCQALPTATNTKTCLFVMVEGDPHTLGLRLAELVAYEAGWKSRWLGANTPLTELPDLIGTRSIHALAVSASQFSSDEPKLQRHARTLEAMCDTAQIPLALGGDGAWPKESPYAKRISDFDSFRKFLISAA